jgi:hypothetical protein
MLSFVRKVWTSPTPAPVSLSALNRAPNDEELLQIHERFFGSRPLGSHGILESLRSLADQSFSRFDAITSWQMPVLAICQSEDWTVP